MKTPREKTEGLPIKKVALCIVATRKYKELIQSLIRSANKYFLTHHQVSFFIFADSPNPNALLDTEIDNIHWSQIEHLPFPLPSLFRYKYILSKQQELTNFDYIFYCDADMRFVGDVGDELLSDGITAIQHPLTAPKDLKDFCHMTEHFKSYAFEKNTNSLAYIRPEEQNMYWCGGIQGGVSEKYLSVIEMLDSNIDKDLGQNIIATYYDESHWNKYLSKNPPSVSLPFWYCFPESADWKNKQNVWKPETRIPDDEEIKILCLDKDLHGGYSSYRGNSKI